MFRMPISLTRGARAILGAVGLLAAGTAAIDKANKPHTRTGSGRYSIFSLTEHKRRYGGKVYPKANREGRTPGSVRRARAANL